MTTGHRRVALALAWACALGGAGLMVLHAIPEAQAITGQMVRAAAFIRHGIVLWVFAIVGFLVGGTRWTKLLALPTAAALVVHIGWVRPGWPHPPPSVPPGTTVRVLAASIPRVGTEPAAVADAIASTNPDIVVLLAANERVLAAPELQPALTALPHRAGRTTPRRQEIGHADAAPTLVLSRHPVIASARLATTHDQLVVDIAVPGTALVLVAAHPVGPDAGGNAWEREGLALAESISPRIGDAVALVGNLNATPNHLTVRRLLDLGLTLGTEQAGAGWQPTSNAGVRWLPPFLDLDHVLTNDRVVTTTYRTLPIRGSDRLAIVADLVVR